jgi:hypothetical protein
VVDVGYIITGIFVITLFCIVGLVAIHDAIFSREE